MPGASTSMRRCSAIFRGSRSTSARQADSGPRTSLAYRGNSRRFCQPKSATVYDVVALRDAKTIFAPGTAWSYSNDGYATLGAICAARRSLVGGLAAGARFRSDRHDEQLAVFTPETMARAAVGYQFRDNDRPASLHPALVASPAMDFVDPAGSVLSTPEDMARYMRFYLNGGRTENGRQLIAPATFAAMTRPDALRSGKPAGAAGVELERSAGLLQTVRITAYRSSTRAATISSAIPAASPATRPACR